MNPSLRPSSPARGRVQAAVALALTACLVLAGCGGDEKPAASASSKRPQSQPTQGGTTLAAVWPLTGLPAPSRTPHHPVLVVKIDNTSSSTPQIGLSKADLVVEELVEGGITRLAAMYYSHVPPVVGPVRSMRASDIGVVKATHAVLVASGAAPPTYHRLRAADVHFRDGGAGYYRAGDRPAPYNLMVRLRDLVKSLGGKPVVPANYLPWGKKTDYAGSGVARQISVRFSPASTTNFSYVKKSHKYANTNSHAAHGDRFSADSVLVLRVREGDAGYLDPAGSHVPETIFQGKGEMLLFHGGKVLHGSWAKKKRSSPLELRTKAGKIKVPPGNVWIELLPINRDGGSVRWGK
ncbi:MAG TPA: DUF3048 domain-containing protein [Marmoricola sp.]|nr:DUF3048 domain-containing protein [Marmoricola sp.]